MNISTTTEVYQQTKTMVRNRQLSMTFLNNFFYYLYECNDGSNINKSKKA